jgi:O-antigen/teichoic acid export membrane protein
LQLINLIKKHAFFGAVFTIAKATVYFIPLLLADVLSKTDFGALEYALAGLGMIINTVINLGVPGSYPYFILKQKEFNLKSTFKLHPIILLIPFVINQVLFFVFNLDINFYLAFNVSFIIANQVFYSTQLKSHEKSISAVILDSGIYLVLLVYYLVIQLNVIQASIKLVNIFVLCYSFLYVVYGSINFFKARKDIAITKYKKILKFSVHLLVSTFLIFLITTSGRILVEYFFDFETVGIYAFYFRLAAIVVMIHQVINIAFFKKIYVLNPIILDKYYYLFFIFMFILSLLVFWIAPFFLNDFSDYFSETYPTYKTVYFLLSAQMVMWIASALNSNIVDRENLASKNNIKFLILTICSLIALFFIKSSLTLSLLTYCHFTIIFLACLIQYHSLSKKKIYFLKSTFTLTLIFLLTSCYYFLFL